MSSIYRAQFSWSSSWKLQIPVWAHTSGLLFQDVFIALYQWLKWFLTIGQTPRLQTGGQTCAHLTVEAHVVELFCSISGKRWDTMWMCMIKQTAVLLECCTETEALYWRGEWQTTKTTHYQNYYKWSLFTVVKVTAIITEMSHIKPVCPILKLHSSSHFTKTFKRFSCCTEEA